MARKTKEAPVPGLPFVPKHTKAVLVFGDPSLSRYDFLKRKMDRLTFWHTDLILVSPLPSVPVGDARRWRGAETLAFRWASDGRFKILRFGPDKPKTMAAFASYAVYFKGGKDPVSQYLLCRCQDAGVKVKIVKV